MNDPTGQAESLLPERILGAAQVPSARRIYVNRNLRLSRVQAIGFDMDHTLALYDRTPFEGLAFDQAKRKLLAAGYPSEIESLRYDGLFVIRGLVVDKRRGNILKLDQHHYVARAYHGTAALSDEIRKRVYRNVPIRLSNRDYMPVDTPFSLPEIDLYAQLVDMLDRRRWRARNYRALYHDVRDAVDQAHADGSIKDVIALDPDRYLVPDPTLPATLHRMKEHGFRLFLLTNSETAYTALIMERLLSGKIESRPSWTEFFDVIVTRAGKPGFFRNRTAAHPADLPGTAPREAAKAYTGGGVRALERLLGCSSDRILYFGDHTYGDILKSKRVRLWRTAMIIQELDAEIMTRERIAGALDGLKAARERREALELFRDALQRTAEGDAPPQMPDLPREEAIPLKESIENEILTLEEEIQRVEAECEREYNVYWGPLFRTDHESSLFASQMREFACIYTARVSNFLHYPVDKYFQVHAEMMPHER